MNSSNTPESFSECVALPEQKMSNKDLHECSKQERAKMLANSYMKANRIFDVLTTIVGIAVIGGWSYTLLPRFDRTDVIGMLLALIIGVFAADLGSGFVHWMADTWGTVDVPYIGKALIRPFREHHVDPTAITRHDFFETNGSNFMLVIPVALWYTYNCATADIETLKINIRLELFMYSLAIFTMFTNQIHKWSHMHYGLPKIAEWLQRFHLILPQKHHRVHHVSPHETYFCITTGWLNYPLEKLRFWSTLEWIIESLTGMQPRVDDRRWAGIKTN